MRKWLLRLLGAEKKQTEGRSEYYELTHAFNDLQQRFKEVEFEWTEMYEKFNTLHARLSKRAKKDGTDNGNGVGQEVQSYGDRLAAARARYGNPYQR